MSTERLLLEFLIPTYKRFDGAIDAAISVASQIKSNDLKNVVSVRITDDASIGFSEKKMHDALSDWDEYISISANNSNKGMSLNIFDMTSTSNAEFCTVLTDDDWLFSGALLEIVFYLKQYLSRSDVGGIFTPRYSYLEDGSLHCVVCRPYVGDRLILPGPINSLRFSQNGFILTGFIFRPHLMAKLDWKANIDNAYFPVINFAHILSSRSIQYVDRNWFRHTVLNVCYWDSWGAGEAEQNRRLYIDYMKAIAFISHRSNSLNRSVYARIVIFVCEFLEYFRQMNNYSLFGTVDISCKGLNFENRLSYSLALNLTPISVFILRKLRILRSSIRRTLNFFHF